MPRIRKKTSKRGTTKKRVSIQNKIVESRKKAKKAAKQNTQWKSKHKKDPGIPNNFPYKDQILAEVAEERRRTVEEKQRRKEEKKAGKEKVDSVKAVVGGSVNNGETFHAEAAEGETDVAVPVNPDLPNLKSILDLANVIIEVLDARDPLPFRSAHLEELAASRPGVRTLLVLNKIDTCPREALVSWSTHLRSQHPTLLFRAASSFLPSPATEPATVGKGKTKVHYDDGLGVDSVLECLGRWAQESGESTLVVAVVGLTNVGKSSFINSLLRKPVLPIYKLATSSPGPTTTTLPQEVVLEVSGKKIRVIDTPGLSWMTSEDQNQSSVDADAIRIHDILLRNKGRIDRLKDPIRPITHIVSHSKPEDLMLLYNLPAFEKGNPDAFLAGVARSHQLIMKRGTLDLAGASRIVLRDWSTGMFPRFTLAPTANSPVQSVMNVELADIYAKDESLLSTHPSRKDLRKNKNVVKFTPGVIESRKAVLEEPWVGSEKDDSDGDGDGDGDHGNESEEVGEGENDGVDSEEESNDESSGMDETEGSVQVISGKGQDRKRIAKGLPTPRPRKKVAFGPDPPSSKRTKQKSHRRRSQR